MSNRRMLRFRVEEAQVLFRFRRIRYPTVLGPVPPPSSIVLHPPAVIRPHRPASCRPAHHILIGHDISIHPAMRTLRYDVPLSDLVTVEIQRRSERVVEIVTAALLVGSIVSRRRHEIRKDDRDRPDAEKHESHRHQKSDRQRQTAVTSEKKGEDENDGHPHHDEAEEDDVRISSGHDETFRFRRLPDPTGCKDKAWLR